MSISSNSDSDVLPDDLRRLYRFARYSVGRFSLGFVRCDVSLRCEAAIQSLEEALRAEDIQLVHLDLSGRFAENLRQAVQQDAVVCQILQSNALAVLVVTGMEHLIDAEAGPAGRPPFAAALNAERDALPQALPLPVLIFLNDHSMDRLDLAAPDFFDWFSSIFNL